MHVHANYSQQLASLGASRNETQEVLARRAIEVRKKLSTASQALLSEAGDEVSRIGARAEEQPRQQQRESDEGEFGRLFSARA